MTGMYDVTSLRTLKTSNTRMPSLTSYTVQIHRTYSSKGIAKIGLCMKRYYNSTFLKFKLSFRT